MKLHCGIVGDNNLIVVEIDDEKTVNGLKIAIAKTTGVECDVGQLQLFLAKKGRAWLTVNEMLEGGVGTVDLQALFVPTARLRAVGLSDNDVQVQVSEQDVADGKSPVNVLVRKLNSNSVVQCYDSSEEWLEEFSKHRILYDNLPPLGELEQFIKQPLPVKIRVTKKLLDEWSKPPMSISKPQQEKMFTVDDTSPCIRLRRRVLSDLVMDPLQVGDTESSFHSFWDLFFSAALTFMLPGGRVNRYSSSNSSTDQIRPDFVFCLNDVCVVRSEETDPGVNLRTPREELCNKLTWVYGHAPYLFGYAAAGYKVDLFALYHNSVGSKVGSFPIGHFNLDRVSDRFKIVHALLNLSLLIPAITEHCPESSLEEFKTICNNFTGVKVQLNAKSVMKIFPNDDKLDHLHRVYGVLAKAKVPNVVRIVKMLTCKNAVVLEPRGTMKRPSNLMELFSALRNVLEALVILHQEKWMHRDIHWSNVVKRYDCNSWFLIDFVYAAASPQSFPNGTHLSREKHAPEIFEEGGFHTTAVDLWSVGFLVETSDVNWDDAPDRAEYHLQLMQSNPAARPSAAEALAALVKLEAKARMEEEMRGKQQQALLEQEMLQQRPPLAWQLLDNKRKRDGNSERWGKKK